LNDRKNFLIGESMFGFEKLEVWQKAIEFANKVYVASREFPEGEKFGLISQIRRCSVSVSSNIAEGSGRSSKSDFARFISIAYGSLMESVSQARIAKDQGFLSTESYQDIYQLAEQLARMLSGLRRSLTKDT
jgi:four helix bundle protein